jgi:6-phosphogluconolactonase
MEMKVRALLSLIVLLMMASLVGCGHYTCGATFGNSSCTTSGSTSISQSGGGKTGSAVAFAYYADDNNGNIGGAMLDSAGNFNAITNFTQPTFSPAIDGNMVIVQKKWLYMPLTSALVLGYSVDGSTGALTALPSSPYVNSTSNFFSITADPAGKFLFLNGDTSQQITVFSINQTDGSLTEVGVYATGGVNAWGSTTDGQGKFLYAAAGPVGISQIAALSIGSTGALTVVPGSPFTFPFHVSQVKGEASGKYLFSVSADVGVNNTSISDHIYSYAINQSTGAISQVTGSPFATTYSPYNLTVHPSGGYVYTFNESSSGVITPMEGFSINSSTGALTEVSNLGSFTPEIGMFDESGAYMFTHGVGELGVLNFSSGNLTSSVTSLGIGSNFGWAATDTH